MMYIIDSDVYDLYYIYDANGLQLATISKTNPDFSNIPEEILIEFQNNTMTRLTNYTDTEKHLGSMIAKKFFGSSNKKYLIIGASAVIALLLLNR